MEKEIKYVDAELDCMVCFHTMHLKIARGQRTSVDISCSCGCTMRLIVFKHGGYRLRRIK